MNLRPGEIVRDVPGYEDYYLVSNLGRVFSKNYRRTGRIEELAQSSLFDKRRSNESMYRRAKMWHIASSTPTAIHPLVAAAFVPNPLGLPMVNHKDGNKANNRDTNLEWCTNAQNLRHAEETGLAKHAVGEDHGCAQMTNERARALHQAITGSARRKGDLSAIATQFGVSRHVVYDMARGKTWRAVL